LTGFAAVVGHVFPIWLRFRGGKGVATAAGVLIAFDWRIGLGVILVWVAVVLATRYSSLASLVGAVAAPLLAWWLQGEGAMLAAVAAMSLLVVMRHRANIGKLLRGEESRVGDKKVKENAA
jgi:glycerol-3-phosphate acyltransferase PlsY